MIIVFGDLPMSRCCHCCCYCIVVAIVVIVIVIVVVIIIITVSPIRAHQVQFTNEASEEDMQLYFKQNDVIKLSWLPQEVVPSYLTNDTENIRLKIELYQIYKTSRDILTWKVIGNNPLIADTANDGSEEVTIPSNLVMDDCPDQNFLCPVAFKISLVSGAIINIVWAGQVTLPRGIGIWSGVAYLQSDSANETYLGIECDKWANAQVNKIPTSRLNELPACPPTLTQATMDNRFRREQFDSPFTNMATGYGEGATKFYHPGIEVCYQQITLDIRFVIQSYNSSYLHTVARNCYC